MFLKKNKLQLGLMLGLLAPLLIFVALYYYRFSGYDIGEFMPLFLHEKQLLTFFGAWCLVGNIALFTFYVNSEKDQTAKGIFVVTLIYGLGILLLKAIL